jgi:simple sugar transport system permease protein
VTTTVVAEPEPTTRPEPVRGPWWDTWLVTVLAVVLALVLGGLLMIFSNERVQTALPYVFDSPGDFFTEAWTVVSDAYSAMFTGAIFDVANDGSLAGILGPLSNTVFTATPLICAGLGVALAFRSGLFNIGGEGQVVAGALAAGYVGFAVDLPPVLHLLAALVAGIAGGAFWGFIAGFLKARTGAHEVITTIMLNYVALLGLKYVLGLKAVQNPQEAQASKVIEPDARLPRLLGQNLQVDLGILLAVAAAAVVWWLLTRSTIGFRLRAVGANPAAARTAGMSVGGSTMLAMLLAGGLAGLGGTTLALGGATSYEVTPAISSNVGFDAITVALLGRTSPWGTVFAGLLLGGLRAGGRTMQAQTGVPIDIVTVIQALIVIFIAAPRLVRALVRLKTRAADALAGVTTNLAVTVETVRAVRIPRHLLAGVLQILLGLLGVVAFALGSRSAGLAKLQLSLPGERFGLGVLEFTARPVALVLCLIAVLAGALRITRVLAAKWCAALAILGLVTAFMVWSVAGTQSGLNLVSLLQGALFPAAIPLILGALAGVVGERAGVVNVAIEGQLLLGAFAAAVVGTVAGSMWAGLAAGIAAGVLVAAILAVLAIRYLVDQVIIGVVLNVLVLGVTSFLFILLLSPQAAELNSPPSFPRYKIPLLGDIPIIGQVLFNGTIFLYLTYVLVFLVHYGLFHTRWGLRLRAVGEHPRAADTVGIKVHRTRYRAVLIAGVLAGLGGAFLVIGAGSNGTFGLNMSSGKGFIALAAVIFGRWRPYGAVAAALLFGFADQLQSLLALAGAPIDTNLLLTLPYIATLIAVAGLVGRVRPPAADGQPYRLG